MSSLHKLPDPPAPWHTCSLRSLCVRSTAPAPAQGGQHCLYDGARPVVAAAALRCKRVYLVGHGAGGALAAAFAALLHTWQDAPQVLAQVRLLAVVALK